MIQKENDGHQDDSFDKDNGFHQEAGVAVKAFFDKASWTLSYVVYCCETKAAVIIDPVLDFDPASATTSNESWQQLLRYCEQQQLTILYLLETHAHADHLSAASVIKQALAQHEVSTHIGAGILDVQAFFNPFYGLTDHNRGQADDFDQLLQDGDTLTLGKQQIKVMTTPGHTPACVSYLIGPFVFVGDTLFSSDYGTARCDFPGGDAVQLYDSIQRIYQLPDETNICLCHDYQPGGRELVWRTTVEEQKQNNVHLTADTSKQAFVAMRTQRDAGLSVPKLILPSIQVNIRGGKFPLDEKSGQAMIMLPVDKL